ncbi:cobyrinate a,c-diamide synthase [Paenactinomyces guangxiensis]|uniref:Cobyrinate a,c-diamide synthase n=1 Tax=Paenactinomyces guangxiensis TaxID=1490290 RepID=A0A7W1WRI0_9BACL|nr:cobyrinate a,c-diamide synthase [Paenactinomyces guangxiensis]MBA4494647.1 cobyrinate a,c-diamide synthase [Paenactinomyces guangxiensis]MBH8591731.1 cobyrinate a,c-diamide synthase [Paenactinomyces guangxiensis]
MSQSRPRIVIAGTESGVGKTTLTLALMAAFKRRGLVVQGFKAGPDYIDPSYHTAVTGRPSRNLDTWILTPECMREIFLRGSQGAELSVIEGVMGLYDGEGPLSDKGSTAEIAIMLQSPCILVVNINRLARSAAAVVKGYQLLNPAVPIAGVIVNQAGGEAHFRMVQAAIEQECGLPVLGWLPQSTAINIPERHLGLVPAVERGEMTPLFERLAKEAERGVNLDQILAIATNAPRLEELADRLFQPLATDNQHRPVIAVAKDEAFNFYYPENLELLEMFGADLLFFSPLRGEPVPDEADGLYIGGGFPEEFVVELAGNDLVKTSFYRRITGGLPAFAECGGYMYLSRSIKDTAGRVHDMVGVIPATVEMKDHLVALGYREVKAETDQLLLRDGEKARGHEFHYSTLTPQTADYSPAYKTTSRWGKQQEGYAKENLLAGYTHLHFASNPAMVHRWLTACREYRHKKRTALG